MVLKYYFDLMSQPSRAVYIFLRLNKIPFEERPVALRKGEHLGDDYAEINPFRKVPAIDDNGFRLSESVAILRYLCTAYDGLVDEHWYPKDVYARARVDQYCAWQHLNLRLYGSMLFRARVLDGKKVPSERYLTGLDKCLDELESIFLPSNNGYIFHLTDVSVADLLCCCELEQPIAAGVDVLSGRPKVAGYMGRVRARLAPVYDSAHRILHAVRDKVAAGKL